MEYFCLLSQMFNYKNKEHNCFINTVAQLLFATKGFVAFANLLAYCANWSDCYACQIKEEPVNKVKLIVGKTNILWRYQFVLGLDEKYEQGSTYDATEFLFKFLTCARGFHGKSYTTYRFV